MADGDEITGSSQPAMTEQTPIGGTPVNLPQPQQQQPIRAPNLADYRMPLIAKLISGIANANKPMPNQQPGQPPMMRPSRLDAFEDFLGNFMYSLSQGLAASGHGPGANLRGAAAAIGAPMQRDVQQFGLNRAAQEAQQSAAQSAADVAQKQAQTGLLTGTVDMIDPQGNTVPVPMSQIGTALGASYRMAGQIGARQITAQAARDISADKIASTEKLTGEKIVAAKQLSDDRITSQQQIAQGRLAIERARMALQSDLTDRKIAAQNDPNKLTMPMKSMKQQAQALLPEIERIDPMIDTVAQKLGPGEGRWNDFWQGKVGVKDPDFARLKDEMGFLESGVALAHARGRMSDTIFNHFKTMFDAGKQDPANMHAAMATARVWMSHYATMGEGGGGGGTTPAVPKLGDVVGGYKFKGGNPADKANWVKK